MIWILPLAITVWFWLSIRAAKRNANDIQADLDSGWIDDYP
jgi:hypothetical protein